MDRIRTLIVNLRHVNGPHSDRNIWHRNIGRTSEVTAPFRPYTLKIQHRIRHRMKQTGDENTENRIHQSRNILFFRINTFGIWFY
jgi:hypothetical protein